MSRMKFNRLTHFMIMVFFAITFVVVYLYYTIKDVKKITNEVQKLSKDVLTLSQSISSITSTLLTQTPVCYAPTQHNTTTSNIQITPKPTVSNQQTELQDDASSEAADDLHKIIETIDDEEFTKEENIDITQCDVEQSFEIPVSEPTEQEQVITTTTTDTPSTKLDAKTLKGLSYDALKKYCKENGIDAKGNKEALISKILVS